MTSAGKQIVQCVEAGLGAKANPPAEPGDWRLLKERTVIGPDLPVDVSYIQGNLLLDRDSFYSTLLETLVRPEF